MKAKVGDRVAWTEPTQRIPARPAVVCIVESLTHDGKPSLIRSESGRHGVFDATRAPYLCVPWPAPEVNHDPGDEDRRAR